jgi:hypothetical protein
MSSTDHDADADADGRLDELLGVLDHEYRRRILLALADSGDWAPPVRPSMASGDEPDVLELELRHVHFPKLEAAGLVEWDRERSAVSRGPRFDEVVPVLDALEAATNESSAARN